jgi:predicted MPP superfamily phosphohydrolase
VAQALGFLAVGLTVVGLIHFYLWRRLIRSTTEPGLARRIGTGLIVALGALLVVTLIGSRVLPHPAAVALSWLGYVWLAVMFYLLITLAVLELPALIARAWLARDVRPVVDQRVPALVGAPSADVTEPGRPDEPEPAPGTSRRLFLARAVAVTAGLASAGIVGPGVAVAMGPPRLRRIDIPLAKLHREADGLRIALVADIHLGPLRGRGHTRQIVDLINGLDADVVAVVGDLVDGSVAELGHAAEPLRGLRSRHGAYFVTGNHEYYSGFHEWVEEVARLGLRPLRNERVELPGGLDLAGVNDITGGSYADAPDLGRALAGRDPSRPVVLLAHQPIQAHDAARHGVDLQLSGHTHGGQMVPFDLVVRLAQQPVVSGLGQVDGMPVYVTNGAGFWGPPVRVGAPPDVTLVRLRAA